MNRIRWIFLTILAVIITIGIFAGGGAQASASSIVTGKKKFSILNASYSVGAIPADIDLNNNKWTDIFKRELPDIEIEWIIATSDITTRKNIMIGSGNPPDVMPMTVSEMIQWSEMGIIRNINGMYESSYKNIYNFSTEDDLIPTKYKGNTYGILVPGNRLTAPNSSLIRTDWLEKVGLSMPKTVEEFYKILHAFTFRDPDGNGKDDTFGLGGIVNFGYLWPMFGMFGVQTDANFTKVGNQIVPDFIRPEMRNAVEFMARLYRDGIMDKDVLVMNANQFQDKIIRGLYGTWSWTANGLTTRHIPGITAANPNAKMELLIPPPSPDGKMYTPITRNGRAIYGISSRCNVPDAVMYFFNWMIEQDTSKLPVFQLNADKIYMGVVGVDSYVLNNKFIMEMPQDRLSPEALIDLYRMSYRTHMGTQQVLPDNLQFEMTRARIENGMVHPVYLDIQLFAEKYGRTNAAAIVGPVYAEHMTEFLTYWNETIASIISGSKPITAFDDFVRFFYSNGGQKVIDEVTALNKF